MSQKEPVHIEIAAQLAARYYWVRKGLAYPMVGLPAAILLLFWVLLQWAQGFKSESIWSSPPNFAKWWVGWGLCLAIFVPGMGVAQWFKWGDWTWKKLDFWGMDKGSKGA